MNDPLAGSDTYDIVAGLAPASLASECRKWGRMEQHEVLQMPHWWSHISRLLIEASYEVRIMNDMVKELRAEIVRANEVPSDSNGYARDILQRALLEAIAEIERLQCIAGAVSNGPSFDEIRDRLKGNFRAHAEPGIVRDVDG